MSNSKTRRLVVTGMLSAVATVLMFLDFPLPMLIPTFIKMDFSDLPALLGAFALGPLYGAVISLVKNLLHILLEGTSTAGVGELSNFILGATFACTAGLIYKHCRTRRGALLGGLCGMLVTAVISVPSNYFITYPAYSFFYGLSMDTILDMYRAILPSVDNILECLIIFNVPFNLVKTGADAFICFLIYKPLSPLLHGRTG